MPTASWFPPRRKRPCQREWAEHDLARCVVAVCGQETGTKKKVLASGAQLSALSHADGRRCAGRLPGGPANGALFFPVNPGAEEASWKRLLDEGLDRFFAGTFAGNYQEELLAAFNRYLPDDPPWRAIMRYSDPSEN